MFTKVETSKKLSVNSHIEKSSVQSQVPSLMAENIRIKGDIVNNGSLQVDGQVEGQVSSKNLVIGLKGVITGDIIAEEITIFGKVVGNIIANMIVLESSSNIEADIEYEKIKICEGSHLNGKLVQNAFASYAAFEGETASVDAPDTDKYKPIETNIGNLKFDINKTS